uniref:Neurexophilin and PC-esterase domain family, member 3 n=1 Tax=Hippocampus comes TaxID=109280 RepID=A0A3Q2XGZ6_HIPCM
MQIMSSPQNWKYHIVSALYKVQNRLQSTNLSGTLRTFHNNHTFCSHLSKPLSHEEELEERKLLNSITWPQLPSGSEPLNLSQTSDPAHSLFTIVLSEKDQRRYVGDQLEVLVHLRDFQGRPKRYGGDFLLARLHSPKYKAGVAGQVLDHKNGLYSARFPLLWEGSAQVEVMMVHSSEAVAVLQRLREKLPPPVRPASTFAFLLFLSFYSFSYYGVNIKVPIHANTTNTITVLQSRKGTLATSGYYYQDSWRPLGDVAMRKFDKAAAISQCLANKVVYMYGDSTIRQWYEYLVTVLPEMKEFNLHTPKKAGPLMAVDSTHNIVLNYRCHGPPIMYTTIMANELRYIANELDGLTGGPNTVVALSIWAHFSPFPGEVYIRRLRHIRKAVVRLLERAPGTVVVVRTGNPRALDRDVSLNHSDWFALQLDIMLRAMFKGLNVMLLDAWQMCVAHHQPHDVHPPKVIVKNMVNMLLSYVCRERTRKAA